jgi:hypothetical protein
MAAEDMKLITVPNIVLAVGLVLNVGGWVRNTAYLEERLKLLEQRVADERVANDLTFMRRDWVLERLDRIQEEQKRQRELTEAIRREVR